MIKVLVVDDSPVICEFLVHVLTSDPELQVVGTANGGGEAMKATATLKPDVITMDIHMPEMDGFEATRRIMEIQPTPIVIVTASSSAKEVASTFRATEAGALAIIPRPAGLGHPEYGATARQLIETVKLMSEVKVIRRWPLKQREGMSASVSPQVEIEAESIPGEVKIIAIGASTGGPVALQTILSQLPHEFPVPVLIVQHIAAGFVDGFAEWLATSSALPVHVAVDGEYLLPGHAYLAPDGFHMEVVAGNYAKLNKKEAEYGLRPSVSHLFRSVARVFGKNAVGVLLSGMGRDGAEELRSMKENGAITIAQDKASSIVNGMSGEAIKLNAATYELPPQQIATTLATLVSKTARGR
jgi:two-component system chemotaxis response regulator CheB